MELWEQLLKDSICTPRQLAEQLDIATDDIDRVHAEFPLRITPYYLSLIKKPGDAIWMQAIPDSQELEGSGVDDPLAEEHDSPVKGITHRYPDRVLFYVSPFCAVYCRFCTRKRKVSDCRSVTNANIEDGIQYIREHKEIRDVVISGGDPFLLSDDKIEYILSSIRKISHVQIIRFGTRTPVTLPQRITPSLCAMLSKYHPVFINTHFNHPDEITPESKKACLMLVDAGIPVGNQSVLLKRVNDNPVIFKRLFQALLQIRVKPYYIYQADLVKGTEHFRTPVSAGLQIIESLRGHTSGLAVPHYVIDAPNGGGKIAVIPNPIVKMTDEEILLRNYEKNIFSYPNIKNVEVECMVQ
jgi:lysine 2,3-aminomutase